MTSQTLDLAGYDLAILDLDGVVYLGSEQVPGAADGVAAIRRSDMKVAYATNNASRRATEVACLLSSLGIPTDSSEVLTSPQAAARMLVERLAPGADVLVVGAEALRAEVDGVGLHAVDSAEPNPSAVVQGYAADVGWRQLAEACVAVRSGALWVATNTDATLPSSRGPLPGNGAMVAAVATALGRGPDQVVGKPEPTLFQHAAERASAHRPLVIGDRLDTDIAGANRAGMHSVLVLTGVTQPRDLLTASAALRPTYIAQGLSTLDSAVAVSAEASGSAAEESGFRVAELDGVLELTGDGPPLAALAALCTAAWLRELREPVRITATTPSAKAAVQSLRLE